MTAPLRDGPTADEIAAARRALRGRSAEAVQAEIAAEPDAVRCWTHIAAVALEDLAWRPAGTVRRWDLAGTLLPPGSLTGRAIAHDPAAMGRVVTWMLERLTFESPDDAARGTHGTIRLLGASGVIAADAPAARAIVAALDAWGRAAPFADRGMHARLVAPMQAAAQAYCAIPTLSEAALVAAAACTDYGAACRQIAAHPHATPAVLAALMGRGDLVDSEDVSRGVRASPNLTTSRAYRNAVMAHVVPYETGQWAADLIAAVLERATGVDEAPWWCDLAAHDLERAVRLVPALAPGVRVAIAPAWLAPALATGAPAALRLAAVSALAAIGDAAPSPPRPARPGR